MANTGDEIKPYKIHVSTKYLQLTKQKLELTRLPHEGSSPKSEEWWEPKPQVEPIIDFWLEKYSWREQEEALNAEFPQFRTAISIPSTETPLRLHFIHVRSAHASAVPLLLIPPFPITNLSLGHLVKPFTDPGGDADGSSSSSSQAFHLVIPALPGLGFSDALPNNTPPIAATADMLDTLMRRLGYAHYLVTNAGAGHVSPAEIDWRLADRLATAHPVSCVGTHLISPPLASPRVSEAPWEWTKWVVAKFFHAGILGYSDDDFTAMMRASSSSSSSKLATPRRQQQQRQQRKKRKKAPLGQPGLGLGLGLSRLGLREPNTLAYALCDSPTGLLVFVLKALRMLEGPRTATSTSASVFSPEQVVTLTNLAWLPGPEYAMRFWAYCALHDDDGEEDARRERSQKPRVAITVFLGGRDADENVPSGASATAAARGASAREGAREEAGEEVLVDMPFSAVEVEQPVTERYVPPAWGRARYDVVHTQRVTGKPGLLAWERPEVIAAGVRGLAKEVLLRDGRLKPIPPPVPAVVVVEAAEAAAPVEQEVAAVPGEETSVGQSGPPLSAAPEQQQQQQQQLPEESTTAQPAATVGSAAAAVRLHTVPEEEGQEKAATSKAKGKEVDTSEPPPAVREPYSDGESPDTLVVNTPLLEV